MSMYAVNCTVPKTLVRHIVEFCAKNSKGKLKAVLEDIERFDMYNSDDLSTALKTENTVYIAVLKSDISSKVYENIKRYQTFLEN